MLGHHWQAREMPFKMVFRWHADDGRQIVVFRSSSPQGAQWLSGRVLDSRRKGRRFEPHRRHHVVVLEQDTFTLA